MFPRRPSVRVKPAANNHAGGQHTWTGNENVSCLFTAGKRERPCAGGIVHHMFCGGETGLDWSVIQVRRWLLTSTGLSQIPNSRAPVLQGTTPAECLYSISYPQPLEARVYAEVICCHSQFRVSCRSRKVFLLHLPSPRTEL